MPLYRSGVGRVREQLAAAAQVRHVVAAQRQCGSWQLGNKRFGVHRRHAVPGLPSIALMRRSLYHTLADADAPCWLVCCELQQVWTWITSFGRFMTHSDPSSLLGKTAVVTGSTSG